MSYIMYAYISSPPQKVVVLHDDDYYIPKETGFGDGCASGEGWGCGGGTGFGFIGHPAGWCPGATGGDHV